MTKRRTLIMILTCICVSVLFSACGKKKAHPEQNQIGQTEIDGNQNGTQNSNQQNAGTAEPTPAPTVAAPAADPAECMAAYERFLNDREKVGFDFYVGSKNADMQYWEYGDLTDAFKKDNEVTFSDFMKLFCKTLSDQYNRQISPNRISYAYIDCGQDKIPELALLITEEDQFTMDFTYMPVIALKDGKLQMISLFEWGYRTEATLNEYGYYHSIGASGAACSSESNYYLDAQGNLQFDFGADYASALYGMYFNNDEAWELGEQLGISDNIEVDRYYLTRYENDTDPEDWEKICIWNYFMTSNNGNVIEDDGIYNDPGNAYYKFWEATGLTRSTDEQIQKAIQEHRTSLGLVDAVVNGREAAWTLLSDEQFKQLYSWQTANLKVADLKMPPWEYVNNTGRPVSTTVDITLASKTPNGVTDDYSWFSNLGIDRPDPFNFDDGAYSYHLYGLDDAGYEWYPYMMDITDLNTGEKLYTLDFSQYYKPDYFAPGEGAYVEESIHWATIRNDILYVSNYHNTYASSAPHNGYITALDLNDNFKVLWRTEPLTCNSDNFVIVDDAIICGYGFTAEDDFVYVLDLSTGKRVSTTKVKTGPDWFYADGQHLYVRCYDTDYVFDLIR